MPIIAIALLLIILVPIAGYTIWVTWTNAINHWYMHGGHGHGSMMYEHCMEDERNELDTEDLILHGLVIERSSDMIELLSGGRQYIILTKGRWVARYGDNMEVVNSSKLLEIIGENETITVYAGKYVSEYGVVIPKKIVVVNKNLTLDSIDYETHVESAEKMCPYM